MAEPRSSLRAHRLLVIAAVAGCAAGVQSARVRGPDGEDNWIAITCKGAQMRCVQRAGESCPHGYEVATAIGHEGQASSAYANRYVAVAQSERTYDGELLVKCKGAPSEEALDPTRFHSCMGDEGCDAGDRCVFDHAGGWGEHGQCRAKR